MRGAPTWTFVVFGDDWGRHVSSMQHVFRMLLDQATVVWVDAIGHREPTLSVADARRAAQKAVAMVGRTRVGEPVRRSAVPDVRPHAHVRPRVLPWHRNAVVSRFNRWSLERDIRRALAQVDCDPDRVVVVSGSPPSAPLVGRLGERSAIYFCMDDFLELPGTTPAMIAPLERQLLERVDAVVATAATLLVKKRCASGTAFHLPQGVNYDHFATPRAVPPELASLPRPIVGFAGGVGAAVDVDTLQALARAMPHGSIVLVGPVTLPEARLRAPNIHVLGNRPYADLPAYVQAFDVGIIPYLESDWTRAVDPLKLLEYLAAGLPVVASPLPEIAKYSDVVSMAPLGAEFVHAVVAATGASVESRERGRAVARRHTWAVRAQQFLDIVERVTGSAVMAEPGLAAAS
jgi:glycosyltransferase involved in cell wall biosynthesis